MGQALGINYQDVNVGFVIASSYCEASAVTFLFNIKWIKLINENEEMEINLIASCKCIYEKAYVIVSFNNRDDSKKRKSFLSKIYSKTMRYSFF